ncbi:MAG: dephospho-CoA kinase [Gammaproteobacteria bacterium]|nr:dephospho-CoA kinase [Gammaproteobacteria bacterium]
MLVIALTGGIGSGKTTVSEIFKSKNIPIIDTDIIARQIVEQDKPAYIEIIKIFGKEILNTDNSINRQALRKLIFSSTDKRLQLESILHPVIWQEVKSQLSSLTSPYCIIVVPLLFENLTKITAVKFDRVLVIDTEEEMQIKRSQKRDNSDIEVIKNIMKSQVSRQVRIDEANDIILNTDNLDSLNKQVEKLHQQYLKLSK